MVGRDEHLARLLAAVKRVPSVAVVEGEAGIGKTRLVAELTAHPDIMARPVLTGACRPTREPFPLGPLVEAVRGTADRLAGAAMSPVVGVLHGLLPELTDVLPPALEPLEDRAAERHRLFRGLAELLSLLGDVVLVVEDLHWADEQTLEFLTWLLGDPPARLSLVLTYRGDEAPVRVRAATARPTDRMAADYITVGPLGVAQIRSLAAAILGLETAEVSEAFATHLSERSSGLPLAVQELLALLRVRGELIRWEGGWARRTIDALDVPAGVRDPVRERVQRLAEPARAVAEAAAVLDVAVPVAVLTEVSGQDACAVDDALDSGLLTAMNGAVGFRHVLASQAVYDGIPPARCQRLHARAAAAVNGMRPVPIGRLAHHLRHAGQDKAWVDAVERAAEQASSLGDHTEAARLLEDVLRNAELTPVRRAALTVRLGWIAAEVLHVPDFVDLFERALGAELPRAVRGELRFILAACLDKARMAPERRRRLFAEAVADLDARPDLAAWATTALGLPSAPLLPVEENLVWLERAMPLLPEVADDGVRLLLLGKIAAVFATVGDGRWAELAARLEAETGGRPRQRRELSAFNSVAMNACLSGHHRASLRLFNAALAGINDVEQVFDQALRCRCGLALNAFCRGDWEGLDEEVTTLLHNLTGRPILEVTAKALLACLALSQGDLDQAAVRLHDVLVRALRSGDFDLLPLAVTALLRLTTARGEVVAGVAATADAVAACELTGAWPVMVRAVPALVEALRAAERADEGAAVVERYAARLRHLEAPFAAPALTHARAVLADGREAAALFAEAAHGYRGLPAIYEAAQADESAATRLFAAGDDTAARALHEAITTYTALGAWWDLDRATRVARQHGMRAPNRRRRELRPEPLLTGRQAEVARLAATGLTNKQIGRELFLSPKTVDKHLGAALRKLGLRSRTELATRMGHAARD